MLNIKKLFAVVLLVAIVVTTMPISLISAADTGVYTYIKAPSSWTVTEGESVSFNVTYSTNPGYTAIVNLTAGHIGMYGFTGNVSISGTGNSRTITISNISLVGEAGYGKYITVNAGTGISSADGSLSNGVKSALFTINAKPAPAPVDDVAPVLTISNPNPSAVTEGGSVSYTLTYTDNVAVAGINLTAGHIGLYGFEGNVSISGSGNTRIVTISNVKNVGTGKYITVNAGTAYDARGNLANGVKGNVFTINAAKVKDTEPPVLTIAGPSASKVTEGSTVTYTLTYRDNVGIYSYNLTTAHIGLYGFTADISLSGEGNVRTVTLSNVRNVGTNKYITVNAGTAVDADGNLANGVKSNPFEIVAAKVRDTEPPVLTIAGPDKAEVYEGETVVYTLKYTDNIGIYSYNLTTAHIGLYGFTADVSISGDGDVKTVTLKNVKNLGDGKYITVNAGTAVDADGNLANGVKSNPFKIIAKTEPTPTPVEPTPVNPTPTPKPADWRPNPNTGIM